MQVQHSGSNRSQSITARVLVFSFLLILANMCLLVACSPADDTPTPAEETATPSSPSPEGSPTSQTADDWKLVLVNTDNPLPADFKIELTELMNGQSVDSRCFSELQEMIDDCRAQGLQPVICSSYRTHEKQQSLFDDKVDRLVAQGLSADNAREEAAKVIAVPGSSEHQLGLAVDIVDIDNQSLDESQEQTEVQQWLMANSWQYGFILRYPADKSDITGISYEPWHYRYVGKDAAKVIYEQGLCLEEYLALITN